MLPADPRLEHTSVTVLLTKPQVSQPLPAPLSVVGCALHQFSHVWLCATPWTVARRAPLSIGSPRPEYWSRLPFPSPGHLSDPENEPGSPALQAGFFTTDHWGSCSVSLHHPPPFSGSLCSDPKGLPSAPRTACSSHHRASAGSAPFSLSYFTRFLDTAAYGLPQRLSSEESASNARDAGDSWQPTRHKVAKSRTWPNPTQGSSLSLLHCRQIFTVETTREAPVKFNHPLNILIILCPFSTWPLYSLWLHFCGIPREICLIH